MKPFYRRPVLQLAALLDMLLIVMFAQFLELKTQIATEQEGQKKQRLEGTTQHADLIAERDSLRAERESQKQKLDELTRRNAELTASAERQRQRETELQEGMTLSTEQRDVIGKLTSELFRLPPDVIEKLLRPAGLASEKRLSAEQVKELTRMFQSLAENRTGETTRHLLTYSELLKRADLWDVYLTEGGNARVEGGGKAMSRLPPVKGSTAEAFAQELVKHYKSVPQPKSVVIILLSYGDVPYAERDLALRGIRMAAERMQEDSNGRTHFEYANLGYHPRDPRR